LTVSAPSPEPFAANSITTGEYNIYNSMKSTSTTPLDNAEIADLGVSLGKRKRLDSNDIGESMRSLGSIMSMDLDLSALGCSSRIQSSDFVKDLLQSDNMPSAIPPLKLERLSTGEMRISSSTWVKDFDGEPIDLGPMDPSLFAHHTSHADMAARLTITPPPLPPLGTSFSPCDYQDYEVPLSSLGYPPVPPLSMPPLPPLDDLVAKDTTSKPKKKKQRRKRMIDESQVVEPTENDVLFGRGGFTNTHPGNLKFRQKALELRPWYEKSSKEEKQRIADVLVEFIKNDGHRFCEKGKDGLWHEVIGNGAHKKASQALRERIRKRSK